MTCERMRDALLQAELAELRGEGESPVAVHVRECAACRRDAARILAATGQLGAVIRRRRGRGWMIALPLAVAAALVLMLRPAPTPGLSPTSGPIPTVASAASAAEVVPLRPTAVRPPMERRPVRASRLGGAPPAVAVAFTPVALVAMPLHPSAHEPARKHPAVLPTSDPAITLLWFE